MDPEMTAAPPAPVQLTRVAYLAMLLAAEKAAQNPAELPVLLEVIKMLEAERDLQEWNAADLDTLEAVRQGHHGVVGDERGYYNLHPRPQAMPLSGEAPRRMLWHGNPGEPAIVVVDQPPIAAERIHRLLHKGALRPTEFWGLTGSPFRAFVVRRRNNVDKPGWSRVSGSESEAGAWLCSGTGQAVGWIPLADDARYLADCVNAVMRLGQDVTRNVPPNPAFPGHLERTGLVGLVRALADALEPQERFGADTPAALRTAATQLDRDLRQLLDDIAVYRRGPQGPVTQTGAMTRH
jgi:hypothetical protein